MESFRQTSLKVSKHCQQRLLQSYSEMKGILSNQQHNLIHSIITSAYRLLISEMSQTQQDLPAVPGLALR